MGCRQDLSALSLSFSSLLLASQEENRPMHTSVTTPELWEPLALASDFPVEETVSKPLPRYCQAYSGMGAPCLIGGLISHGDCLVQTLPQTQGCRPCQEMTSGDPHTYSGRLPRCFFCRLRVPRKTFGPGPGFFLASCNVCTSAT